jgi:hypothetical protein
MPSNEATWVAAAYAEITVSQQTAAAEDTAVITAAVAPLVADLTARRIYTLASTASIPDNVFRDLTTLLAERSAPFFGRETNWEKVALTESRLREADRYNRTAGQDLTRRVLELLEVYGQGRNVMDVTAIEEHATEIIEELAVRGIVTINSIDDIEPAVMPNLARYIAAALSSPPHYPIMDRSARELRTQTRNITDEGVHKTVYF